MTPRTKSRFAFSIGRRAFLGAAGSLAAFLATGQARATLVQGLSLHDLVGRSQHILVLTGLESHCRYEQIAGRRSIVTDTRLRIDDVVARLPVDGAEIVVTTLGGQLDAEGEIVHGQAEFSAGVQCLAFLTRAADDSIWVTGMAQGHYPLAADGEADPQLEASPHMPAIRDWQSCAVRALVGQSLVAARRLVLDTSGQ
jgi:hypothetical protein